jgi:aminoglycoside phosphotransferase (APT) family kinase protein
MIRSSRRYIPQSCDAPSRRPGRVCSLQGPGDLGQTLARVQLQGGQRNFETALVTFGRVEIQPPRVVLHSEGGRPSSIFDPEHVHARVEVLRAVDLMSGPRDLHRILFRCLPPCAAGGYGLPSRPPRMAETLLGCEAARAAHALCRLERSVESVKLPEHIGVSQAVLREVARRYAAPLAGPFEVLPENGIFNAHYRLGPNLVLRVPRNHPEHFAALRREAVAIPTARNAGVHTPDLVAIDNTCALLPGPFAVYRRIEGETLESLDVSPAAAGDIWRELGRELARLHAVAPDAANRSIPPPGPLPDPRELAETHAAAGWFTTTESRWLLSWLAQLAPLALQPARERFVHGDTQASNVMVQPHPLRYVALMDWGSAAWGAQVDDLAVVPLGAVPFLLDGYRESAQIDEDPNLEARIVWRHLQLGLVTLPRGPLPGRSWAERPFTLLLDTLAFFASDPPHAWRELRPRI